MTAHSSETIPPATPLADKRGAPDNAIGAFEAKNKLSSLLQRVEHGESFVITNHGRPVARLTPLTPPRPDGAAAIDQLMELGARHPLKAGEDGLKGLIEAGRR